MQNATLAQWVPIIILKYTIWCLSACLWLMHSVITDPISTKLAGGTKGNTTKVVVLL